MFLELPMNLGVEDETNRKGRQIQPLFKTGGFEKRENDLLKNSIIVFRTIFKKHPA